MQQDDSTAPSTTDEQIEFTDDARTMRYLLQNIKGISPVSGGAMENFAPEYIPTSPEDEDTVS